MTDKIQNMCFGETETESVFRPGGFEITDRAIEYCRFSKTDTLIDIGCGSGGSVEHIRRKYGINTIGVDIAPDAVCRAKDLHPEDRFICERGDLLPFEAGEAAGVLMECSLSKVTSRTDILSECRRVIKPNGYIIISDLYAVGYPARLMGLLKDIDTKENFLKDLNKAGFEVEIFEDYTKKLREMWLQIIFEYGCESLYDNLGIGKDEVKKINPGYMLIVGGRKD